MLPPLKIFPAYGLDNSLLTAVLIGVYIRFFFNEWLGWVFSGLVVPGYLAAIILLRPASAIMIIGEAVVTLAVVRGLASFLSRTKLGTPFFGRDRFVWLCVVSIGVRAVFEAVLAPLVEVKLRAYFGWDPTDSFGLYGIGLVLVPLLANACWKPGLLRGSFQQIICVGTTYLLLRTLLATTNLSFAGVAESFDQVALQFRASPKAYLLLLAGVLLASRANLRFGWDTSGVLIPGLVSLGFFAPLKVLGTVAESLLIALAASLFLRLPRVRDWNVEGPRRVVLMFTTGYAIKFFAVGVLGVTLPSFTATEFFGIGYLLPSLLAMKIWQRRNPATVLVPALGLAVAGLGVGSVVGYELVRISAALPTLALGKSDASLSDARSCASAATFLSELRRSPARMARSLPGPSAPRIATAELDTLAGLLRRMRTLTHQGVKTCYPLLEQVRPGVLGLRLQPATTASGRTFFTLREVAEDADRLRGFGLIAVAAEPHGGPTLIVERPDEDLSDLGALAGLVELTGADAVVIGGLAQAASGRGDVRRDKEVALRTAVHALAGATITLRDSGAAPPSLRGQLPAAIEAALAAKLGPLGHNDPGHPGVELSLSLASQQTLAAAYLPEIRQFANSASWLAMQLANPLPTTALPRSATTDLLLADAVIRPLARAQTAAELATLAQRVAGAASELGLTVAQVAGPHPRIALSGQGEGLLLTPGAPNPSLIEVLSRRRGVAELAAALFDARDARALLISVALPGAVDAGPLGRVAAPVLALTPQLPEVVVVRAGLAPTPDCGVITDALPAAPSPMAQRLLDTLQGMGISCEMRAQYSLDTLEPPGHLVSLLRLRTSSDFVTLQVGPELRERFRPELLTAPQQLLLARLGVESAQLALEEPLAAACSASATDAAPRSAAIPSELVADAQAFAVSRHPALIERLAERAKSERLTLRVIDDTRQGSAYLLLAGQRSAVAITLRPQQTGAVNLSCRRELTEQIRRAQAQGTAVIAVSAP